MKIRDFVCDHPDARILVVDDHETAITTVSRILAAAGYRHVEGTTDPRKVLPLMRELAPDLLILDIRMPHLDGLAVMRQVQARQEDGFLPVLVMTGDPNAQIREQALRSGASDFLQKPFDALEALLRVRNLLKLRFLTHGLENEVRQRTIALERSEIDVAQRLALAAELRDYKSGEHTQRVGVSSALIARTIGLDAREVETIRLAAPLHDIGKIAVPDRILLKDGPLTLQEFETVKQHTTFGARMLAGSASRILQQAEEIALYHHENWDGTGYTPGLGGSMVPLAARIVRVADAFDALVHERPYKGAWPVEEAVELLLEGAGTTFDPDVVDAFVRVLSTNGLPALADEDLESGVNVIDELDLAPLIRILAPDGEVAVTSDDGHAVSEESD